MRKIFERHKNNWPKCYKQLYDCDDESQGSGAYKVAALGIGFILMMIPAQVLMCLIELFCCKPLLSCKWFVFKEKVSIELFPA